MDGVAEVRIKQITKLNIKTFTVQKHHAPLNWPFPEWTESHITQILACLYKLSGEPHLFKFVDRRNHNEGSVATAINI